MSRRLFHAVRDASIGQPTKTLQGKRRAEAIAAKPLASEIIARRERTTTRTTSWSLAVVRRSPGKEIVGIDPTARTRGDERIELWCQAQWRRGQINSMAWSAEV